MNDTVSTKWIIPMRGGDSEAVSIVRLVGRVWH